MQTHKGKKLLILGSSTGSVDLIKHAQNHGAIVYVADYYDAEHSPAKRYADEAVLLSTADTNSLEAYIRSEKIDCVYAGISEFNLIQARSSLNAAIFLSIAMKISGTELLTKRPFVSCA